MFEDLIIKRINIDQCPCCKANVITKRKGGNRRLAYCVKCKQFWYIVWDHKVEKHSIQYIDKAKRTQK